MIGMSEEAFDWAVSNNEQILAQVDISHMQAEVAEWLDRSTLELRVVGSRNLKPQLRLVLGSRVQATVQTCTNSARRVLVANSL